MSAILCKKEVHLNLAETSYIYSATFVGDDGGGGGEYYTTHRQIICNAGVSKLLHAVKTLIRKIVFWRKSAIICKEQIVNFYLGIFRKIMVL